MHFTKFLVQFYDFGATSVYRTQQRGFGNKKFFPQKVTPLGYFHAGNTNLTFLKLENEPIDEKMRLKRKRLEKNSKTFTVFSIKSHFSYLMVHFQALKISNSCSPHENTPRGHFL